MLDPRQDPNVYISPQWQKWATEAGGDAYNIEYAWRLCMELMAEHGVSDWRLRIGGARDLSASVRYTKNDDGVWDGEPGTLTLSGPLMSLWTPGQARDTILHEIAHIMCPDHGHDTTWRGWCRILGARPTRLWGEAGEKEIKKPLVGTCRGGHPHRRRRRQPGQLWYCLRCGPVGDPRALITWDKEHSGV